MQTSCRITEWPFNRLSPDPTILYLLTASLLVIYNCLGSLSCFNFFKNRPFRYHCDIPLHFVGTAPRHTQFRLISSTSHYFRFARKLPDHFRHTWWGFGPQAKGMEMSWGKFSANAKRVAGFFKTLLFSRPQVHWKSTFINLIKFDRRKLWEMSMKKKKRKFLLILWRFFNFVSLSFNRR